MNFRELKDGLQALGLDSSRLVALLGPDELSLASPEVANNLIVGPDGVRILSGTGRGRLVATPYEGFVFKTEQEACDFVWRMIRSEVAPHSLTPQERETLRREALEILDR